MNLVEMQALETRARWRQWCPAGVADSLYKEHNGNVPEDALRAGGAYYHCLCNGPTFYMNAAFGALVDFARIDVPDALMYEPSWLLTKSGFLWLENPFEVPNPTAFSETPKVCKIRAVGWLPVVSASTDVAFFMFFMELGQKFGMWSYLALQPGEALGERMRQLEDAGDHVHPGGEYDLGDKRTRDLHEVRWLYAALHLMSQQVARHEEKSVSGLVRGMIDRKHGFVGQPLLRTVTLRRVAQEHADGAQPSGRVYTCQWPVRGHWRSQFYPSENLHRQVYITPYVKGPEDKPLRTPAHTVFKAVR